jgi:hypothetical protein
MKNGIRFLGLVAAVAIMGFGFAGCKKDADMLVVIIHDIKGEFPSLIELTIDFIPASSLSEVCRDSVKDGTATFYPRGAGTGIEGTYALSLGTGMETIAKSDGGISLKYGETHLKVEGDKLVKK